MIFHVNHRESDRTDLTGRVVSKLLPLINDGELESGALEGLSVHLDWVQYKTNFRESISVRRAIKNGSQLPLLDVAVDLRQVREETLSAEFRSALRAARQNGLQAEQRQYLETYKPLRSSLIW